MKTLKSIVFLMIGLFAVDTAWGHALWIETAAEGQTGDTHNIKIHYGEPANGNVDRVSDWWSDVSAFTLVLHLPDGSTQTLKTTAAADHFRASFTPETEGTYVLSIVQPVEETFDGHKYQFNSTAIIHIGKTDTSSAVTQSEFRVLPEARGALKTDQALQVRVLLDGKPVEKLEVSVFSPGGWSKTFYTDKEGRIQFTPDRSGRYLVEVLNSQEVSGKDFTHLHRVATWSVVLD